MTCLTADSNAHKKPSQVLGFLWALVLLSGGAEHPSSGYAILVGVSLLTKTVLQPLKMQRMFRPFREQARSHMDGVDA
jgi:hypothetical protein